MRYVLLTAIVFLVSVMSLRVDSQVTNPCDAGLGTGTITLTLATPTSPFSAGVCQKALDANGNPTTITAIAVQIDGTEVYRNLPAGAIGPNASGDTYYQTPKTLTAPLGNHTVTVFAVNAQGVSTGTSRPFVLKLAATTPVGASGVNVQ